MNFSAFLKGATPLGVHANLQASGESWSIRGGISTDFITKPLNNIFGQSKIRIGEFSIGISSGNSFATPPLEMVYARFGDQLYEDGPWNWETGKPQPWVSMTDPDDIKTATRFDSYPNPGESGTRDTARIQSFLNSPKGSIFQSRQARNQLLNAFNETREWNVESVIPNSDQRGFAALTRYNSNGIIDGVATTAYDSQQDGQGGIAIAAGNIEDMVSGLVRYNTAAWARSNFSKKWSASPITIVSNEVQSADWDRRIEYSSTLDVFETFLNDPRGLLVYSVANFKVPNGGEPYGAKDIHVFTSDPSKVYSPTPQQTNEPNGFDLKRNQEQLEAGTFDPNIVRGNAITNKRDLIDTSTTAMRVVSTTEESQQAIVGATNINFVSDALQKWNTSYKLTNPNSDFFFGGVTTYQTKRKLTEKGSSDTYGKKKLSTDETLEKSKDFGGAQKSDGYNLFTPMSGDDAVQKALLADESTSTSRDLIFFYFYDMVNDKYIPFRATVQGINENVSPKWEEVNYMGRADLLFTYNGFTRDLNFNFTVYAASVKELMPMWRRINYLSGLTRPSKYTSGTGPVSNFMYPPLIKFRIGDLYVDQPAIIRSFGLTVPDDASWELTRVDFQYQYLLNTFQQIDFSPSIASDRVTRQLPMQVDISISLGLMEKELSKTGNELYFVDAAASDFHPVPVSSKVIPPASTTNQPAEGVVSSQAPKQTYPSTIRRHDDGWV